MCWDGVDRISNFFSEYCNSWRYSDKRYESLLAHHIWAVFAAFYLGKKNVDTRGALTFVDGQIEFASIVFKEPYKRKVFPQASCNCVYSDKDSLVSLTMAKTQRDYGLRRYSENDDGESFSTRILKECRNHLIICNASVADIGIRDFIFEPYSLMPVFVNTFVPINPKLRVDADQIWMLAITEYERFGTRFKELWSYAERLRKVDMC